jgi:hypothetical protein
VLRTFCVCVLLTSGLSSRLLHTPPHVRLRLLAGLEGLVMKDARSVYQPGKRKWLKMKRDYLGAGSLADSCDLVGIACPVRSIDHPIARDGCVGLAATEVGLGACHSFSCA